MKEIFALKPNSMSRFLSQESNSMFARNSIQQQQQQQTTATAALDGKS